VLLLSRPFTVGDYIRLKSGALGGVTDGLVAEIGITYLRLGTEDGTLPLPNSQVLAAAVGPIAQPGPGNQSRSPRNRYRPASQPSRLMATRRTAGRRTDRHDAPAQWCFTSYLATTSAGMRPRSLTSIPLCLAQLRMAALCCR
jgi:Mechanosensitive ion channel